MVPVKVPAFAVTVISPVPSKSTLFIFLAVANFVEVLAVPAVEAVINSKPGRDEIRNYLLFLGINLSNYGLS